MFLELQNTSSGVLGDEKNISIILSDILSPSPLFLIGKGEEFAIAADWNYVDYY